MIDKGHSISLLVANRPGVLVRIALVFSRRGYNIDSLVVSPTLDPNFSRMNIIAHGNPEILMQIIKQLEKLVDVVQAKDHTGTDAVEKELALIKVRCTPDQRTEILQLCDHFHANTVGNSVNIYIDNIGVELYANFEGPDMVTNLTATAGEMGALVNTLMRLLHRHLQRRFAAGSDQLRRSRHR